MEYVAQAPKESPFEALTRELAPYLPPGHEKGSAFFKTTKRGEREKLLLANRKGFIDVNYEPRHNLTKKKSIFLTKINAAATQAR